MNKHERLMKWHRDNGTRFLDELPEGWHYMNGATTAPRGWKGGRGSLFSADHEHVLIRQRG